jgi:protein-S-isoprenylcysteine O-methyltransferase Ste14
MLKTGEWLSLSVIGLVALFIFLTLSFFSFLIGPNSTGPKTTIEPSSSFIQIIFISIGPAIVLSFFTNIFSKDISKISSIMVLFSGVILIIGMIYVSFRVPQVQNIELPIWISNIPLIFIGFGILLFLIGLINYKKSKKQEQKKTFELD